jgi:hypothetical protein
VASKSPCAAALAIRRCEKCWYVFRASTDRCPGCGNEYVPTQRKIIERRGALEEKQRAAKAAAVERFAARAGDADKIDKMAAWFKVSKERQYKPGWVFGRYAAVFKEKPTSEIIRAARAR